MFIRARWLREVYRWQQDGSLVLPEYGRTNATGLLAFLAVHLLRLPSTVLARTVAGCVIRRDPMAGRADGCGGWCLLNTLHAGRRIPAVLFHAAFNIHARSTPDCSAYTVHGGARYAGGFTVLRGRLRCLATVPLLHAGEDVQRCGYGRTSLFTYLPASACLPAAGRAERHGALLKRIAYFLH